MRELDVKALRRRLERGEFDGWLVAYHELHLDGAGPAALVASEIHNSLSPLWQYFGVEREPTTAEDHLPPVVFGEKKTIKPPDPEEENDALIAALERLYG